MFSLTMAICWRKSWEKWNKKKTTRTLMVHAISIKHEEMGKKRMFTRVNVSTILCVASNERKPYSRVSFFLFFLKKKTQFKFLIHPCSPSIEIEIWNRRRKRNKKKLLIINKSEMIPIVNRFLFSSFQKTEEGHLLMNY